MEHLLRIASVSNQLEMANPQNAVTDICAQITRASMEGAEVLLFPMYALTGDRLGTMEKNTTFIKECQKAVHEIAVYAKGKVPVVVLGSITADGPAAVVIEQQSEIEIQEFEQYLGAAIGVIGGDIGWPLDPQAPKPDTDSINEMPEDISIRYIPYPSSTINQFPIYTEPIIYEGVKLAVFPTLEENDLHQLLIFYNLHQIPIPDVMLLPSFLPTPAGKTKKIQKSLEYISLTTNCAIAVANGGNGASSFPDIHKPFTGIFECGDTLAFNDFIMDGNFTIREIDLDIIRSKTNPLYLNSVEAYDESADITTRPRKLLMRNISKTPYLPEEKSERENYLTEVCELQIISLAARMKNINVEKLVVGVSGGLDSTLALLVSIGAMNALNFPASNIIAVTMPGFGTTDNTYNNAVQLIKQTGCTFKEIPIAASVTQHFKDIGQNIDNHDVTYENAQARERTQILLDLANMYYAIVVGTGDLSEEALGFCTFSGDHLANYNVNVCITKGMIREIVSILSQEYQEDVAAVLRAILDTPVSPELLPPLETGETQQKTEEILGPYLLHDFFAYYFVMHHFSPSKLFAYACSAFEGELEQSFILDKLRIFIKRFIAGQFKRSCAPDSAAITEFNLLSQNLSIPSDMNSTALLAEIEKIEINK